MGKHLLFISPVSELGAGCRYRIQQYLPFLEAEGLRVTVRPFYSDALFELMYTRGSSGRKAVLSCQRVLVRLMHLGSLASFDGVFIYREAVPIGPPVWEWCCARLGKPIVLDFDDAIFLGDTNPVNRAAEVLKCAWKVPSLLRWSRHVIAGNAYLAAYAQAHARRVTIIPTPVDTTLYQPLRSVPAGGGTLPVIGWIGTPTNAKYLEALREAFCRLARRRRFVLRIVGARRPLGFPGVTLDEHAWSPETELEEFQRCDIGLYPLLDDAWSRGKCGLKALQFMACGVPVVASRVGMSPEFISPGVNGFLASSMDEWVDALEALLDDAALRRRCGQAARATVEQGYSLATQAPRFLQVLREAYTGSG